MQKPCLNNLKTWFLQNKRDFPWRKAISPYRVWVSEVMLQQTQAEVVKDYFERWMQRFPDIISLANASLSEVIKLWEGLGYYSRARNLHIGAKQILENFNGQIPDSFTELSKIKGLGPYTIGAILSFAFHKPIAAVDGNVIRVLTRVFGIEDDISKSQTVKRLRNLASSFLNEEESWIVNEALIELGATICRPRPFCEKCPILPACSAHKNALTKKIPYKSRKMETTSLKRGVAILFYKNQVLIKKETQGVMADLHEFPYFSWEDRDLTEFQAHVENHFGFRALKILRLKRVQHTFTRFKANLEPTLFFLQMPIVSPGFAWIHLEELKQLAFSSGHRRILADLLTLPFAS